MPPRFQAILPAFIGSLPSTIDPIRRKIDMLRFGNRCLRRTAQNFQIGATSRRALAAAAAPAQQTFAFSDKPPVVSAQSAELCFLPGYVAWAQAKITHELPSTNQYDLIVIGRFATAARLLRVLQVIPQWTVWPEMRCALPPNRSLPTSELHRVCLNAAISAAKKLKKVCVIDRNEMLGGVCIHTGALVFPANKFATRRSANLNSGCCARLSRHDSVQDVSRGCALPDWSSSAVRALRIVYLRAHSMCGLRLQWFLRQRVLGARAHLVAGHSDARQESRGLGDGDGGGSADAQSHHARVWHCQIPG